MLGPCLRMADLFCVDLSARAGKWLLVVASGFCGNVLAQGCPVGISSASNPGCIPPDQSNSPCHQSGGASGNAPAGQWEKRWGAFVIDDKVGLGVSKNMPNKQMAQTAAIDDCVQKGGTQCKIQLVYSNQCGVIIEGDKTYNAARAPTVEKAKEIGLDVCRRSDKNCQVYFSDCSYPALVR